MGSVYNEIERIENAKSDIETAIEECGVNVPDDNLIDTYGNYIRQIPSAVFSNFNVDTIGNDTTYIKTIKQENGLISATTGGLVTTASCGLVPAADSAINVISDQTNDWVLTKKGTSVDWYKLPTNAYLNDKVTQTVTTTSNTSWRPILLGYSDSDPFNPTEVTNLVYASHLIKVKPDEGILSADKFIGNLEGTADNADKIKISTTTAATLYPLLSSGSSGLSGSSGSSYNNVVYRNGFQCTYQTGTDGNRISLKLGEADATKTCGDIYIYGTSTGGIKLKPCDATSIVQFDFPYTGGTLITHVTRGTAVGSSTKPVYINSNSRATACTYSLNVTVNSGTNGKLAYYGTNTIDDYTSSVGNTAKPMYLNAGVPTVCSATKGSATKPVYMNAGEFAPCTYSLNATINSGTSTRLAYYSETNAISSAEKISISSGLIKVVNTSGNEDLGLQVTGNSNKIGFIIGEGNSNRGIYDYTNSNWIIYKDINNSINIPHTATTSTIYISGTNASGNGHYTGTRSTNGVRVVSGSQVWAYGGFYESSDNRLKNFISDIDVDLEKLSQLPKKYFTWKSDEINELNIGTSAQELQKLYPELVKEEDGILHVAYDKLSIIALKAIDKLYEKIKDLENQINKLK